MNLNYVLVLPIKIDTSCFLCFQKEFVSMEIVDGFVVYKYDLGSGVAIITSTKTIDDGMWHAIIAERYARMHP